MTALRASLAQAMRPARDASREQNAVVRAAGLVAIALVAVGLFTASWDRLGNIDLAGYNVKVPALAFSLAALAGLPALWAHRRILRFAPIRVLAALVAAIVVVLLVSTVLSRQPSAGLAQVIAVGTGAIAPAIAVISVVRSRADLMWALDWFIAGAALAGAFGIYQLVAFYLGWPQFVDYTGVGVGGGPGRIAAFSYEPAYFANFLILAFGAAAVSARLRGRTLSWVPVGAFALVLVLVNVRALYFLIPVVVVLLAIRWRQNRRLLLRAAIAGVVVVVLNVSVTQLITYVAERSAATPPVAAPAVTAPTGTDPPPAVTEPDTGPPGGSPTTVLDPNEQSSNAPRLALYGAVLEVVAAHPVLGVGPGNLRPALEDVGYAPPNQGSQVVANNIWLQALADGGIVLLLLELGVAVVLAVLLFRRRAAPVQPLIAALLAVLGVSGMLTSYFFDVKIWVVLAMVVSGLALLPEAAKHQPFHEDADVV